MKRQREEEQDTTSSSTSSTSTQPPPTKQRKITDNELISEISSSYNRIRDPNSLYAVYKHSIVSTNLPEAGRVDKRKTIDCCGLFKTEKEALLYCICKNNVKHLGYEPLTIMKNQNLKKLNSETKKKAQQKAKNDENACFFDYKKVEISLPKDVLDFIKGDEDYRIDCEIAENVFPENKNKYYGC